MPAEERRTIDQLRKAYEIEKELSAKLRDADKEQRMQAYHAAYDAWNARVFRDQHLSPGSDVTGRGRSLRYQKKMLKKFLRPQVSFLEIGPGDCSLLVEVAKLVNEVYAVDVAKRPGDGFLLPPRGKFLLSDGCSIPLPPESIDVAYSNQVLEHLHPDDAGEQLHNIYDALTPGGIYLCITPHRFSGPHDISRYFDEVASGFHIREYTVTELVEIFRKTGFSTCRLLIGAKGYYMTWPTHPVRWIEWLLSKLPHALSRKIALFPPLRLLLGIKLVAAK